MFNFDEINPEAFSAEFEELESLKAELHEAEEQISLTQVQGFVNFGFTVPEAIEAVRENKPKVTDEIIGNWMYTFGFTREEAIQVCTSPSPCEVYMTEEEILRALNSGR